MRSVRRCAILRPFWAPPQPPTETGFGAGDLAGLLTSAGAIADAFRYDPAGELVASYVAGNPSPWRYQGALDRNDGATPLYAIGARDYAPSIAAWTSEDTYAGAALDPASLNRFLYAEADPVSLTDPSGHAGCKPGVKCGTSVGTYYVADNKTESVTRRHGSSATVYHSQSTGGEVVIGSPGYETPPSDARACGRSCRSDSMGLFYDPFGNDPWGYPTPFLCQGVQDVWACENQLASMDASQNESVSGACLAIQAEAGIMGGVSICNTAGHAQLQLQVGASTGIGISVTGQRASSSTASPSDVSGLGAGFGWSVGEAVVGGYDRCFAVGSTGSIGCDAYSAGVGLKVTGALPGEIHAYGSFTIDLNDSIHRAARDLRSILGLPNQFEGGGGGNF